MFRVSGVLGLLQVESVLGSRCFGWKMWKVFWVLSVLCIKCFWGHGCFGYRVFWTVSVLEYFFCLQCMTFSL